MHPDRRAQSGVRVTTPPSGGLANTPTGGIAGLGLGAAGPGMGLGNDQSGLRPGKCGTNRGDGQRRVRAARELR